MLLAPGPAAQGKLVRELKGFRRVTLLPGQKQEISFVIGREERNYWSAAKDGWVVEASDFDVWVGNNSQSNLHNTFTVVQLGIASSGRGNSKSAMEGR